MVRRLFVAFALTIFALTLSADEVSVHAFQSGETDGPDTFHQKGIHGEGEVIAVLDTGVDWDNCYLAEEDNSAPPVNTIAPEGGLDASHVDPLRRKVIAYDFLYSCDEFPHAVGCEVPLNTHAFDNQGHGTHAAASALGDRGAFLFHDEGDAIAPGAKLVVQDAGYIGGDNCSQRPGLLCPLRDLRPVLFQAYQQGVRIHSNSWGDRQGTPADQTPPTGNYGTGARDLDAFVDAHPDMLVVFNTGNAGSDGVETTLSSPGCAKNTLQVGGMQFLGNGKRQVVFYSGKGPTLDGRLKPELVGPASVLAGDSDFDVTTRNCDDSTQGGTSWSSPTVAGAAALARQYYREGWYPTGSKVSADGIDPSAALLRATLIAGARRIPWLQTNRGGLRASAPTPSYEQGFGFPVLGDVLRFEGDARQLEVLDRSDDRGLEAGRTLERVYRVSEGTPLRVVLAWTDPPGDPALDGADPQLINDLDLEVRGPSGELLHGNETLHPGQADHINNVEAVLIDAPAAGLYRVTVRANALGAGPRQGFALVTTGDFESGPRRRHPVRRPSLNGSVMVQPAASGPSSPHQ